MTTLLTLVEALARDPEAKADYAAGPDAYLERHGFGDLSPADVNEAVLHASDTLPAPAAAQVDHTGGLDSVASVDPTSFHADPGGDYEGDLFGHDPGDGFDDDTDGVGDDGHDAFDELLDQHGQPGPDGPETQHAHPDADADQRAQAQPDDDDADGDADGDDAAGPSATLATLPDPHDLDGEHGGASAVADTDATEATTPAGDDPAGEDVDDDDLDDFGTDRSVFDVDDSTAADFGPPGGGLESALTADDPFASPGFGGDTAWYDEPVTPSYDVEPDEPDDDILDDVDDIHVNGN